MKRVFFNSARESICEFSTVNTRFSSRILRVNPLRIELSHVARPNHFRHHNYYPYLRALMKKIVKTYLLWHHAWNMFFSFGFCLSCSSQACSNRVADCRGHQRSTSLCCCSTLPCPTMSMASSELSNQISVPVWGSNTVIYPQLLSAADLQAYQFFISPDDIFILTRVLHGTNNAFAHQ